MQQPAIEPAGHRDAVFGLAEHEGRVLLVSNPRVVGGQARELWDLPGGALQAGERLPEALAREWREETGLAVEVGPLAFVVDGAKRTAAGALLYTWRAFVFRVACEGAPEAGPGIAAAAWVPRAEAVRRLDAPYHAQLRAWLAGDETRYASLTWTDTTAPPAGAATALRPLVVVAAAAAVGDRALLARALEAARAGGEDESRLVETLLQVVPYAGYPRAITAFGVLRRTVRAPAVPETGGADASGRGRTTFDAVYGETAADVVAGLVALDPVLARWTLEHAYGRVLARTGVLDLAERELLAVAILTALGGLAEPLLGHMRACVRLGTGAQEVAGVIAAVPASVGEARRLEARALLARLEPARPDA